MTVTKKFNNLDTDNTLGGNSPSDYRVSSQKAIKEYIDNAGATAFVNLSTAQTVAGDKTFTGVTRFQNGSGNGCVILGADVSNTTVSNNARKLGRMSFHTYENTVNCAFVSTDSQNSGDVNTNYVEFGGRTGDSTNTSPDVLRFTLTKVHNSTATADKLYGLVMSYSDGANFGVQPKYNNVNLATTNDIPTNYVTTNTGQAVTATKTFKAQMVLQTGSYQGGLVLGADAGATTLTDDARKVARIVSRTQDLTINSAIINFDSNNNYNVIDIGGAQTEAVNTAPDVINFTVAGTHNSKTDKSIAFTVNKNNANFSVRPKYNNVNLATENWVINQNYVNGTSLTNILTDYALISSFAEVATSGDYDDLINKPTIPSAVTESTVSNWGFIKNSVNNLTNYYTKTEIDNIRKLVEFKKPTTSSPSWYNLYSDGYVEQGGEITVGNTKTEQVTFSKEFENNKYMPILTCITYTAGNIDGLCHITELTTTGMKIFDASGRTYRWECKGYVATS